MSCPNNVEGISQTQEKKESCNQLTSTNQNVNVNRKTNEESAKKNNNGLKSIELPPLIYTKNNTDTYMIINQMPPNGVKPALQMPKLALSQPIITILPSPNIAVRPSVNIATPPAINVAVRPSPNIVIQPPINSAIQCLPDIAPPPPPKISTPPPANVSIQPSPKTPTWIPPKVAIQSALNLVAGPENRVENVPNNRINPHATKPANPDRLMPSKRKTNLTLKPVHEGYDTNLLKILLRPPAPRTIEPSASLSRNHQSESNSMPMLLDLFEPPPLVPTKQAMAQQNAKNLLVPKKKIIPSIIKKRFSGNIFIQNEKSYSFESNTTKPVKEKPPKPKPVRTQRQPAKERKSNILRNMASNKEEKGESNNRDVKAKRRKQSDTGLDSKVENIYIADGLKDDCENLISKCMQVYKLNYEKFSEIWKQMNFSRIFQGRQSSAEIAELSEEAIHIAKAYMVARNVNFEENVAGLFIVYAFLNCQPYEGFAALRLVPKDVPAVKALEIEARKQRRHDVLYILGSVLIKGPCQFHVAPREVALEMPIRKYHDGSIHSSTGSREGTLYKNRKIGTLLKELIDRHKRMNEVLERIEKKTGNKIVASRPKIDKIYHKFRDLTPNTVLNRDGEMKRDEIKVPTPEKTTDRHEMVAAIKRKAMVNMVVPMRHLTGIDERKDKSLTPPTSAGAKLADAEGNKPPTPYKGKGKGKGKGTGRSSAKNLDALFDLSTFEGMSEAKPYEETSQSLDIIDDTFQNASNDVNLTVNEVQTATMPNKRKSSLLPRIDDGPCIKNRKKSNGDASEKGVSKTLRTYAKSPRKGKENAEQLAKSETDNASKASKPGPANQAVKTKTKMTQLFSDDSDIDSDEIDNIPLFNLIHRAPSVADESHNEISNAIKNPSTESKDDDKQKPQTELVHTNQELDIQLDSIPEIRSTDKNIEIEIIDNFKANGAPFRNAQENTETVSKKHDRSEETDDAEDCILKKRNDLGPSSEPTTSLLNLDQIELRSKRKEKRQYKRIRIKSKLRKLGILGVANFDDGKDDRT